MRLEKVSISPLDLIDAIFGILATNGINVTLSIVSNIFLVNKKLAEMAGVKRCETNISEIFFTIFAKITVKPLFQALSQTIPNNFLLKGLGDNYNFLTNFEELYNSIRRPIIGTT